MWKVFLPMPANSWGSKQAQSRPYQRNCTGHSSRTKVIASNPRSTVGTKTEIYDYLKLLYARIGTTYSPISGHAVKKDRVGDVVDFFGFPSGRQQILAAHYSTNTRSKSKERIDILIQQGYARIFTKGMQRIDSMERNSQKNLLELVVDRVIVRKDDEDFNNRPWQMPSMLPFLKGRPL